MNKLQDLTTMEIKLLQWEGALRRKIKEISTRDDSIIMVLVNASTGRGVFSDPVSFAGHSYASIKKQFVLM